MLMMDENNETVIIDSIYDPIKSQYFWTLNLEQRDFMLSPLLILEELVAPSIKLQIGGYGFYIPSMWNVVVFDDETTSIDTVPIFDLFGKDFKVLAYGPKCSKPYGIRGAVVDYIPEYKMAYPSLNKTQLLCHPISASLFIMISGTDSFNKYLKNADISDII